MTAEIELKTDARGVTTLWLNRPDVHNALNAAAMDAITDFADALKPGGQTRVLVLAGRGRSFCAGGDLGWMRSQFKATAAKRDHEARRLANMLLSLYNLNIPVIGRIHGNAFGGGVGVVSACDVAIGVTGRKLGLTETKLGLIPATIGPYVAARLGAHTRSVFMSARLFEAQEAVRLGLLARAVAPEDLDAAIEAEVTPYLSCAPGAVADAKRQARELGPRIDREVIDKSIRALAARWDDPEAREGIAAFFEKREPSWQA